MDVSVVTAPRLGVCAASLAVIAGLVSAQTTGVPAKEGPSAFAGCYRLELGRWTRFWILPATPDAAQIPPDAFQLDTEPADRVIPNAFRIHPNTKRRTSHLDNWGFSTDDSDALYVTWTDGFVGVSLELKHAGDRLVGHATAFTDAHVFPFPSARAIAVRVACETTGGR
jgi:hypothetical protein